MKDSILVDIGNDGDFVGISTFCREHDSRGRFLISWRTIMLALTGNERAMTLDTDCSSFAELWWEDDYLYIRFTWLSVYYMDQVQGFKQTIHIPKSLIMSMYGSKCRRKYLCLPLREQAKIDATGVSTTIRLILKDKHTRRAFSKAMRDCFKWQGDEVKLYNDGAYNFYFTTKSGFPKNGGLILHEGGQRTTYPYVYYSVHT